MLSSISYLFSIHAMGQTVASWWHLSIHYSLEQVIFPGAEFANHSAQLGSKSGVVFPFLQHHQSTHVYIC